MKFLKLLRARMRLFFGTCPACNSDAPELDHCKVCQGVTWNDRSGRPPSRIVKSVWLRNYRRALEEKESAR